MKEYMIGERAGQERAFALYPSAGSVPVFGINAFDTPEWSEYCTITMIPEIRCRVSEQKQLVHNWIQPYFFSLLPVIQSIIIEKGYVEIVDIGGGQGENFIYIENFFSDNDIRWYVIEQEKNCRYGRKQHMSDKIHFYENGCFDSECLCEEAKALLMHADICLLVGALQYFDPYYKLLKEITSTSVSYIYITRTLMVNEAETMYTRYYIAPGSGKYKDIILADAATAIINHKDLMQYMYSYGYLCCLDIFQESSFSDLRALAELYNKCEYRDILYQRIKAQT